ncbi:hypothetical protein Cantr_00445 [Candida viswanathii]|uniref:Pdp3-interacting factor 1 n=1 Tax=Candida viswanathii TaxID=5486 RepID=A0A367YFS6_9ASCO|nr:hypothetical protein Cantr_00445 [Candida viswanathii]
MRYPTTSASPIRRLSLLMKYQTTKPPRVVVTDWDETVTVDDTIQYVSEVPYLNNPALSPPFSYFVKNYFDNYSSYSKNFGERKTLDDEITFQRGILPIESQSIESIEQHEIFKGLTRAHFEAQAHKIQIRPGFSEFVAKCNQLRIPVVVLSANWTSLMIQQALLNHGIQVNQIITNELIFEQGKTTGYWDRTNRIRVSQDKLNVIERRFNCGDVMYVGDSGTDLLPLLHVDIPCVIENTKIVTILNNIGLQDNVNIGSWHDFIDLIKE